MRDDRFDQRNMVGAMPQVDDNDDSPNDVTRIYINYFVDANHNTINAFKIADRLDGIHRGKRINLPSRMSEHNQCMKDPANESRKHVIGRTYDPLLNDCDPAILFDVAEM